MGSFFAGHHYRRVSWVFLSHSTIALAVGQFPTSYMLRGLVILCLARFEVRGAHFAGSLYPSMLAHPETPVTLLHEDHPSPRYTEKAQSRTLELSRCEWTGINVLHDSMKNGRCHLSVLAGSFIM